MANGSSESPGHEPAAAVRILGLAFLALIAMMWLFSDILLPFLAGLALAYFLDPVADALERAGFSRLRFDI